MLIYEAMAPMVAHEQSRSAYPDPMLMTALAVEVVQYIDEHGRWLRVRTTAAPRGGKVTCDSGQRLSRRRPAILFAVPESRDRPDGGAGVGKADRIEVQFSTVGGEGSPDVRSGRIPDVPVTRSHPPASWPSAANSSICRTYRKTAGEESRRRSPVANRWMRP